MANIQFDYQYRDAGGSKASDFVIFANPDDLEPEEVKLRLEQALWDREFFIADQIRIPEVFLYLDGRVDDVVDHCFHHFDSLVPTSSAETDAHKRSIREFVHEVESQSSLGWRVFDPVERFES